MRNKIFNNKKYWCGGKGNPNTDNNRCTRGHVLTDIRRYPLPQGLAAVDPAQLARLKALRGVVHQQTLDAMWTEYADLRRTERTECKHTR